MHGSNAALPVFKRGTCSQHALSTKLPFAPLADPQKTTAQLPQWPQKTYKTPLNHPSPPAQLPKAGVKRTSTDSPPPKDKQLEDASPPQKKHRYRPCIKVRRKRPASRPPEERISKRPRGLPLYLRTNYVLNSNSSSCSSKQSGHLPEGAEQPSISSTQSERCRLGHIRTHNIHARMQTSQPGQPCLLSQTGAPPFISWQGKRPRSKRSTTRKPMCSPPHAELQINCAYRTGIPIRTTSVQIFNFKREKFSQNSFI
jgi:hypothetical protein